MHSLEPEIQQLLRTGELSPAEARQPLARETRAIFSVRRELRAALYFGLAAVMAGVGLVVKENLDHIGPMVIILSIAVAAALCYLPAVLAQRAGQARRLPADLLLLLAALLVSSDLGYAEYRFQLLGDDWTLHLLVLAAVHGLTAYALGSRLVLSVALTSFALWVGAATTFSGFFPLSRITVAGTGWRTLACALCVVGMRAVHAKKMRSRQDFIDVYESFAVHLAGAGALLLLLPGYLDRPLPSASLLPGFLVLATVVALIGGIGWRRRQESFVLAALAYAIVGVWRLEFWLLDDLLSLTAASLATLIIAIAVLWRVHARFKAGR